MVKVTFDPLRVNLEKVLIQFWESHNPTQGDRQGNDVGTDYRMLNKAPAFRSNFSVPRVWQHPGCGLSWH